MPRRDWRRRRQWPSGASNSTVLCWKSVRRFAFYQTGSARHTSAPQLHADVGLRHVGIAKQLAARINFAIAVRASPTPTAALTTSGKIAYLRRRPSSLDCSDGSVSSKCAQRASALVVDHLGAGRLCAGVGGGTAADDEPGGDDGSNEGGNMVFHDESPQK